MANSIMGDRTTWIEKCPKCGADIEVYSAPSSLIWRKHCHICGYDDGLDYYEAPNYVIEKLTEKEAREKKIIFDCPKCKTIMTWWEKKKYGMCISCHQEKTNKLKNHESRSNSTNSRNYQDPKS